MAVDPSSRVGTRAMGPVMPGRKAEIRRHSMRWSRDEKFDTKRKRGGQVDPTGNVEIPTKRRPEHRWCASGGKTRASCSAPRPDRSTPLNGSSDSTGLPISEATFVMTLAISALSSPEHAPAPIIAPALLPATAVEAAHCG